MYFNQKEKARLRKKYGDWALVTGASSGIGLELAERLAEAGFNLILNARNRFRLKDIKGRLEKTYPITIIIVDADCSDTAGIEKIKIAAEEVTPGLVILCAGYGTSGLFHHSILADEIAMLRVNCEGLLQLTHFFTGAFIKNKRGGIILMSSLVSFQGVPYAAHYAATKAYVQSLGEALAAEVKPFGVDVLTVAPGPVKSGFEKRANMKMDLFMHPPAIGIPILKAIGRKNTVLPGVLSKVLVWSLRTLPRWGKIRVMQKIMGGMTQHQREFSTKMSLPVDTGV